MKLDPYEALGLSRNPFIAEDVTGVPSSLWIDRGFSLAPPVGARLLVQVIGEKGAGKSSHLEHWRAQTGGSYTYYPEGLERWRFPPVAKIAYWDEADRIPKLLLLLALGRASRMSATIVVGTHADLSWAARRVGLEVQTITLPPLNVETLMAWVNLRIEAVRLPGVADVGLHLAPEMAAKIADECGASLRVAAVPLHIWAAEVASRAVRDNCS